jgi:hypothetical protein
MEELLAGRTNHSLIVVTRSKKETRDRSDLMMAFFVIGR